MGKNYHENWRELEESNFLQYITCNTSGSKGAGNRRNEMGVWVLWKKKGWSGTAVETTPFDGKYPFFNASSIVSGVHRVETTIY